MNGPVGTVVSGVLIACVSAGTVSGLGMYKDVEILKERTASLEETLKDREETTKRFTAMMMQIDKTLAVQTEAVNTLKEAVKRLEQSNFAYIGERYNDSRN